MEGRRLRDIAASGFRSVQATCLCVHFRDKETLFRTLVGDLANGLESPNLSNSDRDKLSVRQYL